MKSKLLFIITALILFIPKINFGQAPPPLGAAATFALFTSSGAITHTGAGMDSHITGDVGSNGGGLTTGFGNIDGHMYDGSTQSASATLDLNAAYLNASTQAPATLHGIGFGNETLPPAIYSVGGPSTLGGILTLDGLGDPNAYFLFQLNGPFASSAFAEVKLINGTKACNVFWVVEGNADFATFTKMKGTIIAHTGQITMATGVSLEGRALSTAGLVAVNTGLTLTTPIGCGSVVNVGPLAPALGATSCFEILSADGPVTNVGITFITGDVGTNLGSTTGFNPLNVVGAIHPIPDGITAAAATDLGNVYNYLNLLPSDIELLVPSEFGHSLVLTPHTYVMLSAVTFTDTLFLNAQGDPNAVFVIQVTGAFNTSVYSNVVLQNGALSKNVFWKISGAVTINDYSEFKGTIVSNGAISLNTGAMLEGRALTLVGAINTAAINAGTPPGSCGSVAAPIIIVQPLNQMACSGSSVSFSVTASGTGLTYQWRKGAVDLINGGNISGATTSVLTINPASILDVASDYNVIVSGASTPNDTSNDVSLTLSNGAVITTEPMNQNVCSGTSASFSVVASGSLLTYQWRKGLINLINGVNISGATSPTLIINPASITDTAFNYNVIVMSSCGNDTSMNAGLTVGGVVISTEPANKTVCSGNTVSFSVIASGSGIMYQWRKGSVNLINGANISGATTSVLTINPANISDAALNYNVIVSGSCSPNDTSINVSLTVNPTPAASAGSNSPVCTGAAINLTAQTVTGGNYNWTGPNGFLSLVQNPVILSASSANAGIYFLTVSANGCSSAPSNTTVAVNTCNADLSVVKTVNNIHPFYGTSLVFTIVATNNGPSNATGVEVLDQLQNGYVYVSSTATAGTYDPSTGIWTIGNLNNGSSVTLTITATVIMGGNYVNTAIIYGSQSDVNMADNNSSVETQPTDFNIPEGFSPNGDGTNDLFVIRGIQNYPENSITIFNRWGNKVFEAKPYENTWDGKSTKGLKVGGDDLPIGTYFYILDLGDNEKVYKGTIYLNK